MRNEVNMFRGNTNRAGTNWNMMNIPPATINHIKSGLTSFLLIFMPGNSPLKLSFSGVYG